LAFDFSISLSLHSLAKAIGVSCFLVLRIATYAYYWEGADPGGFECVVGRVGRAERGFEPQPLHPRLENKLTIKFDHHFGVEGLGSRVQGAGFRV